MSEGLENIIEGMNVILKNIPVERLLSSDMHGVIYNALLRFEPRISNMEIETIHKDPLFGIIKVLITFTINVTNTRHAIVYPIYFSEGSDIQCI